VLFRADIERQGGWEDKERLGVSLSWTTPKAEDKRNAEIVTEHELCNLVTPEVTQRDRQLMSNARHKL
jgi:hypothetical protein